MNNCANCGKQIYAQDTACSNCGTTLLSAQKPTAHKTNFIRYDPRLIQEFAQCLYRRAAVIMFVYALLGAGIIYFVFTTYTNDGKYAVPGAIIGGLVGFLIGSREAFSLRLQAQLALCQAQIEENTRAKRT